MASIKCDWTRSLPNNIPSNVGFLLISCSHARWKGIKSTFCNVDKWVDGSMDGSVGRWTSLGLFRVFSYTLQWRKCSASTLTHRWTKRRLGKPPNGKWTCRWEKILWLVILEFPLSSLWRRFVLILINHPYLALLAWGKKSNRLFHLFCCFSGGLHGHVGKRKRLSRGEVWLYPNAPAKLVLEM